MSNPNNKLNFDAISFDDVIGDGAPGLDPVIDEEPQEVEAPEELINELDEDAKERGDEDYEDYVDEEPEEESRQTSVEDDYTDEGEEFDSSGSVASQISEILGFEIENDYADTVEGLTEYVRDISREVAESQLEELFQQFPEVQKHLDYVLSGGNSEQFFEAHNPQSDYSKVQISEKDTMTQKVLLSQYFQMKGHDDAFINEMLEDYEDSGKLFGKAKIAKDALVQAQQAQRQHMLQQQQIEYERQQEQENQFWDGVANTIESGNEFAGITIPDRDKRGFFDYISSPVDDSGRTQREVDYSEAPMEVKLAIDYLLYSGFNLEDIINTKAKTASARNLRDRIISNQEQVKSAKGAQRRKQAAFDPDNLDITALF